MIRFRWKYVDLRGKKRGGREVMPKGERAEKREKKGEKQAVDAGGRRVRRLSLLIFTISAPDNL